MSTTLIENRKNGADLKRCTNMERIFCLEMMASETFNQTEAAKRAKYKHPAQAAAKLMKRPHIKAILGKFQREREERTQITSDRIWEYMDRVLQFDPGEIYEDAGDGWWYIGKLQEMPRKIRQMIENSEPAVMKVGTDDDGDDVLQKCMKVKFVSKTSVLGMAARHAIPPPIQKHKVEVVRMDLDSLVIDSQFSDDPIEDRLRMEDGR